MSENSSRRRGANFNLGAEQAEADKKLLRSAFYASDDYRAIADKDDHHCFLVARTGSGKSAALQQLEADFPDHVVRIDPEDLSLPYITNSDVMRSLNEMNVSLDTLFIALWKHVLLVELIRHRYKMDSQEAKMNIMATLRDKIKRDPAKKEALDYLEEFQGRFWVDTDLRIKEVTEKFEKRISQEAQGKIGLPGQVNASLGATSGDTQSSEVRAEFADRYQKIVNDQQMPRLNKMIKVLGDDILSSRHDFRYVVIDDLDRDWVDEKLLNSLIRCLLRAVLDLQRVENLKVIVALRTNIFEQLDFGHRLGGQEEKFRSLVMRMRWTPSQLEELVSERLRVASASNGPQLNSIYDLLPRSRGAGGDALQYMMDRTLMRPRDIIAFLNESLSTSRGAEEISWDDIMTAEEEYSHKRLLALRDEWKTNFPEIDRIFYLFEGVTLPIPQQEFTYILENAVTHPSFNSMTWLHEMTAGVYTYSDGTWVDWYGRLVTLLYNIGFIGCLTGRRSNFRFAQDFPDFAERARSLESVTHFTVHPAFRAGLETRQDTSWR
ncbi:P-loop ATPase, Sll1717 family [Streptomyces sp. FR-108]|uniref:P-loop ATPase, Sll1717 family n=1 Tax=Streptomyces sp. FR-108 TaxID=3416665 RepID=UPI003CEAB387